MKKINYIDSIRNPIITEKATILSEQNKTVFKVHQGANKKTIKKNIEKLFKVNVIKVNIINTKIITISNVANTSTNPGQIFVDSPSLFLKDLDAIIIFYF